MAKVGSWAFLVGVILAIALGAFGTLSRTMAILLVLLGLVVGFLNITQKEVKGFLMAAVSLVIVAYFGKGAMEIIPILGHMLDALLVMFVPATMIVALKSVFSYAKR